MRTRTCALRARMRTRAHAHALAEFSPHPPIQQTPPTHQYPMSGFMNHNKIEASYHTQPSQAKPGKARLRGVECLGFNIVLSF